MARRTDSGRTRKGQIGMGRILKAVAVLAVLGAIGLIGFAYLGDLTPAPSEMRKPVELNAGS